MGYCLPKFASEKLLKDLKNGNVNPEKLIDMTSKERREFFSKIVGEDNATQTNALFESKLLLKNQQQGIINWAKQLTGIKPEVQRDILARVNKMTDVLQPKELDLFLEDLAEKKLGFGVSLDEANKIAELAKNVSESRDSENRLDYGRAKVAFSDYVNGLKEESKKESLKDQIKNPAKLIIKVGGQAKSLKASLDNSAIFRQGWKTMFTDPKIWFKNAKATFKDIVDTLGNKPVMDEIRAEIISRPNYDKMVKAKLAIGNIEEAFPDSLPEKIPGFGRVYKASENAYTGFVYKMRADIFDKYLDIADKAGVDITDKEQLESIGTLVNSLTGRGKLGKLEPAAEVVNNVFFSPRFTKSHLDVLTAHQFSKEATPFVKKQAAINLAKIIGGTALILAIANAIKPGSVESDPRSSDFGKIKVGNTRFDVSGGMASVITLAARLGTMSSKSTVTGEVNPLNSGKFGSQTGMNVFYSFLENKASPLGAVFLHYLKGQDSNGNKPTILGEAKDFFTPLPFSNYQNLKEDPNSANILASVILDGLGVSVSDYGGSPTGLVAKDKPDVYREVLEKIVAGDREGAQTLAHDFNTRLHESIEQDLIKKDSSLSPEKLNEQIELKFKKDAIYMPTDKQIDDYKTGGIEAVDKILANGKPVIKQDTAIPNQGVIGTVVTYAHALGVDPVTAFNDIFKGQRIRKVTNGTVIVDRMSLKDSQQLKSDRGGNNPTMKLDHTLPLQLGGNNEESNLKLVPTEEWSKYTPVEDYLGRALKANKVDKKTAQSLILDFKNGKITYDEIKAKVDKK